MVPKLSEIWSGLFILDPDPEFFSIPDPGVKKAPDPGSRGQKGTGSRIQGSKSHRIPDPQHWYWWRLCVHLRGAVMDWRLKSALAAAGLAPASSPACGSAPALRGRTKLLSSETESASKWCSNTKHGQCCGSGSVRKFLGLLDPDPFIIKQMHSWT